MSVANSDWLAEYGSLKQAILSKRKAGLLFSHDEIIFFNSAASSLESKLKILSTAQRSNGLVVSEIARRQVLVDNIKKLVLTLKGQSLSESSNSSSISSHPYTEDVINANSASIKASVLSEASGAVGSGAQSTGYSAVNTSEKGLAMRLMDMAGLHNELLQDIDSGVVRLHAQAVDMQTETSMHERLLDHMEGNVDMAIISLQEEAKRISKAKEKVFAFRLNMCLCIEVVILILLLLILASRG